MEGICKRLAPECVLLDIQVEDKRSAVSAMANSLATHYSFSNVEELVADILAREQLASTCLGFGCAVPHAHSAGLETTYIGAARLSPPLVDETPDDQPVTLMFLLVGPPGRASLHLKLLSKLARLLHDGELRDKLLGATTQKEFLNSICEKEHGT
jgi:mannitol/fructose-specific phosphotransferase system IIA component (Ntr-type)